MTNHLDHCQQRDKDTEGNQNQEQSSSRNSTTGQTSRFNNNHNTQGLIDLRPNFAIIKHNIDDKLKENNRAVPAPNWFFNIPTTRSPFPDVRGILTQNCED